MKGMFNDFSKLVYQKNQCLSAFICGLERLKNWSFQNSRLCYIPLRTSVLFGRLTPKLGRFFFEFVGLTSRFVGSVRFLVSKVFFLGTPWLSCEARGGGV